MGQHMSQSLEVKFRGWVSVEFSSMGVSWFLYESSLPSVLQNWTKFLQVPEYQSWIGRVHSELTRRVWLLGMSAPESGHYHNSKSQELVRQVGCQKVKAAQAEKNHNSEGNNWKWDQSRWRWFYKALHCIKNFRHIPKTKTKEQS